MQRADAAGDQRVLCETAHEDLGPLQKSEFDIQKGEPSNIAAFHRWAFKWLEKSNFVVLPSDKDGTFTLVDRSEFPAMIKTKLPRQTYFPIEKSSVDMQTLRISYFGCVKRVAEVLNSPQSHRYTKKVLLHSDPARIFSRLQYTIKAHKPPGQIAPRVIHSCAGHPFRALAHVLAIEIEKDIARAPHLSSSSRAFCQRIARMRVAPNDRLCRIDLDHFFMDAPQQMLVDNAFVSEAHTSRAY